MYRLCWDADQNGIEALVLHLGSCHTSHADKESDCFDLHKRPCPAQQFAIATGPSSFDSGIAKREALCCLRHFLPTPTESDVGCLTSATPPSNEVSVHA